MEFIGIITLILVLITGFSLVLFIGRRIQSAKLAYPVAILGGITYFIVISVISLFVSTAFALGSMYQLGADNAASISEITPQTSPE